MEQWASRLDRPRQERQRSRAKELTADSYGELPDQEAILEREGRAAAATPTPGPRLDSGTGGRRSKSRNGMNGMNGNTSSQSSLLPKPDEIRPSSQMGGRDQMGDFGIPWGAVTHSGGWGTKEWQMDGLEVSGRGLSSSHGGRLLSAGAVERASPMDAGAKFYDGKRRSEMQVEDLGSDTEGNAAGASRPLSKWELKNWEPSRGKKKPKPQGGNIRRSSTLPFESSLAPELLSLFAS
jgi:hypothetical protein